MQFVQCMLETADVYLRATLRVVTAYVFKNVNFVLITLSFNRTQCLASFSLIELVYKISFEKLAELSTVYLLLVQTINEIVLD